jgi:hypothetical protein
MRNVSANATTVMSSVIAAATSPTSVNFFTGVTSLILVGYQGAQLSSSSQLVLRRERY